MSFVKIKSNDGTIRCDFSDGYSSVLIPSKNGKNTVCVSSQIGCPVGCSFCHTGKFIRNLTAEEILEQIRVFDASITSVVFMGMGEPMLNFSNVSKAVDLINKEFSVAYSRITVSTSGFNLGEFFSLPCSLALSLHSAIESTRSKLVPNGMSLSDMLPLISDYCSTRKHGLMIEYALMDGVNDNDDELEALLSVNWPKNINFNLIEFNDCGDFKGSSRLEYFKSKIRDAGYKCFIRESRGKDISAACGMLDMPKHL